MTKWTLGQVGKTKPKQSQFKANTNPIQTQTNPNKPNFKGKKMMLRLTINGLRKTVLIFYVKQSLTVQVGNDIWEIGSLKTIERKEQQW